MARWQGLCLCARLPYERARGSLAGLGGKKNPGLLLLVQEIQKNTTSRTFATAHWVSVLRYTLRKDARNTFDCLSLNCFIGNNEASCCGSLKEKNPIRITRLVLQLGTVTFLVCGSLLYESFYITVYSSYIQPQWFDC